MKKVFEEFFETGIVGKSTNSAFITLVPKKERSKKARDFRPISLVTSLYKILSKVLANRLAIVLSHTISLEKSAFVRGTGF